jgi:hypothetical protein
MYDISGFGTSVEISASVTFPSGFTVTEFADDADSVDTPSLAVADTAMGVNGDLIVWSKANPIKVTISVIPDGDDDSNLQALWAANRVAKGQQSARDIIEATVAYPSGKTVQLSSGKILEGIPFNSIASAGRFKSKPYMFVFEDVNFQS